MAPPPIGQMRNFCLETSQQIYRQARPLLSTSTEISFISMDGDTCLTPTSFARFTSYSNDKPIISTAGYEISPENETTVIGNNALKKEMQTASHPKSEHERWWGILASRVCTDINAGFEYKGHYYGYLSEPLMYMNPNLTQKLFEEKELKYASFTSDNIAPFGFHDNEGRRMKRFVSALGDVQVIGPSKQPEQRALLKNYWRFLSAPPQTLKQQLSKEAYLDVITAIYNQPQQSIRPYFSGSNVAHSFSLEPGGVRQLASYFYIKAFFMLLELGPNRGYYFSLAIRHYLNDEEQRYNQDMFRINETDFKTFFDDHFTYDNVRQNRSEGVFTNKETFKETMLVLATWSLSVCHTLKTWFHGDYQEEKDAQGTYIPMDCPNDYPKKAEEMVKIDEAKQLPVNPPTVPLLPKSKLCQKYIDHLSITHPQLRYLRRSDPYASFMPLFKKCPELDTLAYHPNPTELIPQWISILYVEQSLTDDLRNHVKTLLMSIMVTKQTSSVLATCLLSYDSKVSVEHLTLVLPSDSKDELPNQVSLERTPLVYRTAGGGDCAFHAALGTIQADDSVKHSNIKQVRIDFSSYICTIEDKDTLSKTLFLEAMKELVMNSARIPRSMSTLWEFVEQYQTYVDSHSDIIDAAFKLFYIKLTQYRNIMTYVDENHECKQSNPPFKAKFLDALNRNDFLLCGLLLSIPDLYQSYQVFTDTANASFDFSVLNTDIYIQEYARYISTSGVWLLPVELHLMARLFKKTIHFHTINNQETSFVATYNPGMSDEISVRHNGRNHYERMRRSLAPQAILLDSETKNSVSNKSAKKRRHSQAQDSPLNKKTKVGDRKDVKEEGGGQDNESESLKTNPDAPVRIPKKRSLDGASQHPGHLNKKIKLNDNRVSDTETPNIPMSLNTKPVQHSDKEEGEVSDSDSDSEPDEKVQGDNSRTYIPNNESPRDKKLNLDLTTKTCCDLIQNNNVEGFITFLQKLPNGINTALKNKVTPFMLILLYGCLQFLKDVTQHIYIQQDPQKKYLEAKDSKERYTIVYAAQKKEMIAYLLENLHYPLRYIQNSMNKILYSSNVEVLEYLYQDPKLKDYIKANIDNLIKSVEKSRSRHKEKVVNYLKKIKNTLHTHSLRRKPRKR